MLAFDELIRGKVIRVIGGKVIRSKTISVKLVCRKRFRWPPCAQFMLVTAPCSGPKKST